ncbi:hypothetical protein GRI47_04615 [Erythrobacter pelagi]|uniref:Uncharacterized protein n=1 Tax=Qipengyuania pelagi TaxID=994320 RepID=A0A844Y726_9SPHN|nr:hypothetical protein [Qipengyuania pelagi]MXO53289.1 hypothetical protein [Qipengyuania pelagi]
MKTRKANEREESIAENARRRRKRIALENPALNLGVRRARTPEQGRQRCGAGSEKKHVTTFVRRPSHQTPVILKPDGAAEGTTDQISRGKSVLRDIVWKTQNFLEVEMSPDRGMKIQGRLR